MKSMFVISSLNIDMVASVEHLPRRGETIFANRFESFFGGKGANQAIAAAKLGATVALYGKVGTDAYGAEYRQMLENLPLKELQIDVSETEPTGRAFIHVSESGENQITVIPGANLSIQKEDIQKLSLIHKNTALALSQFEVPQEATVKAFMRAKQENPQCLTIFNPAPIMPITDELWNCIDILIPNETEIKGICQQSFHNTEDLVSACQTLIADKNVKCVIVTMGEKGSLFVTKDFYHVIPAEKVTAKDTTAAGDSFIGAFASYLLGQEKVTDKTLLDSVAYANLVASITVQTAGAQSSLPTKKDVEKQNWLNGTYQ